MGGRGGHSLRDFLNFTVTQERFGVTAVTAAIQKAPGTPSEQFVPALRAIVTTEFTHVEALEAIGAEPLTSKFWIPDAVFDGGVVLFTSFAAVEAIEVSLYLVGVTAFTVARTRSARGCAPKRSGRRPSTECCPGSPPPRSARRRHRRPTWVSSRSPTRPPARSRKALMGLGIGYGEQSSAPGAFYEYPGDPVANGVGVPVDSPTPE